VCTARPDKGVCQTTARRIPEREGEPKKRCPPHFIGSSLRWRRGVRRARACVPPLGLLWFLSPVQDVLRPPRQRCLRLYRPDRLRASGIPRESLQGALQERIRLLSGSRSGLPGLWSRGAGSLPDCEEKAFPVVRFESRPASREQYAVFAYPPDCDPIRSCFQSCLPPFCRPSGSSVFLSLDALLYAYPRWVRAYGDSADYHCFVESACVRTGMQQAR